MQIQASSPLIAFDSSLRILSGFGPERAALLKKIGLHTLKDLLFHLPIEIEVRRPLFSLSHARTGTLVTALVDIVKHVPPVSKGKPYKILCSLGGNTLELVFFHRKGQYLTTLAPEGSQRVVSGKLERFSHIFSIPHPDHIGSVVTFDQWIGIQPIYPLTAGISQKQLRWAIKDVLKKVPPLEEWTSTSLSWHEAILKVHAPQTALDLSPLSPARQRLVYDEILAQQLSLQLIRHHHHTVKGVSKTIHNDLLQRALCLLPFKLTADQHQALKDIRTDLTSPHQMLRLLQGDVGSGKTIVAFLAILMGISAGYQGALLAPTDILARQHLEKLSPLIAALGLNVTFLSSRERGKGRDAILQTIQEGKAHIIIGTHALFQEGIRFHKLGIAVIDEQHRFGVEQRLALSEKGHYPDLLAMSATPIPRTLALSRYGDLDVTLLHNKPAGRKPIITTLLDLHRLKELTDALQRAIHQGKKIYWVCPLIEESESLDLTAAQDRFHHLEGLFGSKVGLIHGQMKSEEREKVMEAFAKGPLQLLVATTVIEVGVDVPEATIMIVERAERFGLAQLHQLRGRVGRGAEESSCILLYGHPLSPTARKRLEAMRRTNDGFKIAEADLKLRGSGETLGTRQSGLPKYRLGEFTDHPDLLETFLEKAHREARDLVSSDPHLRSPKGLAARTLLSLFDKDTAMRYIRSA